MMQNAPPDRDGWIIGGLLALIILVAFSTPGVAAAEGPRMQPPAKIGDCRWVHGRFEVANGSSIQRIWIIGTKRIVALPDDYPHLPKVLSEYEAAYAWREQPGKDTALYADFRVCALEDDRPGHMQHVRVDILRNGLVAGKPFPGR
jgi:hypothetical protein